MRAAWGIFFDTPHLFFNTRFANNPPWGAQITIPNPAGGWADRRYLGYPGGNPFPALATDWATAAFPAFGVYVNAPLDLQPTALHQWNVSVQRQVGDWMVSASYWAIARCTCGAQRSSIRRCSSPVPPRGTPTNGAC